MPDPFTPNAAIQASGPLSFCNGGSVTLTSTPGASYLWSPGGQTTPSIVVNNSGTYTVRVTDAAGNSATSAAVTVTVTQQAPMPVITSSGPLKACLGGSVTLTASPAGSYLWSNGATTQSILATATGNYSVTATTFGCSATSLPVNFQVLAPPAAPAITSSGPLTTCPGTPVVLTASQADGYLWSNGATTRSIAVNAGGNYQVRAYNAPYCFTPSAPVQVIQLPAPPVPAVTASGSLALNAQNPAVQLIASPAAAYNWSSGETTQSISVSIPGSYRVTVTGLNGCRSISAPVSVSGNGCTPPPVPAITVAGITNLQPGETVTLFSPLAGGYLWSNGATTRSITVSTAGVYSVRNYNGPYCYSTSLPVTITVLPARIRASVPTETPLADFSIFPNPAIDKVNCSFYSVVSSKANIRLVDASGRIYHSSDREVAEGNNTFDLSLPELRPGVYFLQLTTGEMNELRRLVIQ